MEIQAASQLYQVNITIHQLNQPRWEIPNFPGKRTIHLSYHDGDHYSSVRSIGNYSFENFALSFSIVFFFSGEPDFGMPKDVVFSVSKILLVQQTINVNLPLFISQHHMYQRKREKPLIVTKKIMNLLLITKR